MAKSANSIWALALIACVAIGLGVVAQQWGSQSPALKKAILLPTPRALPEVKFTSHTGDSFTTKDFAGKWQILFFGFTFCPDICPTTLYTLKQVKQRLVESKQWGNVAVKMITVDPQRDTAQRLAQYVPFFDAEFTGLTSDLASIEEFAKSVGVLFVAHEPDANGNYDVDHSASLILINPAGQYAGVISTPHDVEEMTQDIAILAQANKEDAVTNKAQSMAEALVLKDPWLRPAPPMASAHAAYLVAENNSTEKVNVVGASSPMFEEVLIHTTDISEAMASMDTVDKLVIAPGSSIAFEPLGTHLMLMEPINEIVEGDLVPIMLELSDGSVAQAIFPVQQPPESK